MCKITCTYPHFAEFAMKLRRTSLALSVTIAFVANAAYAATPVAYVTSEKGSIGTIDLNNLTVEQTFQLPGRDPRGLSLTADGALLAVADKNFGELAVLNTQTGEIAKHVKIGENPEYVRIRGTLAYVTFEPRSVRQARDKSSASDEDSDKPTAEIAIVDMKTSKVIRSVPSGHETEGVEFSRDDKQMLVTNEGDDTVSIYDAHTGAPIGIIKLFAGSRPRGIKASPDGQVYVVTLESLSKFAVVDAKDWHIVKVVPTKLGPYGVAYDPTGQRLLVAAARDQTLQVFDAHTYEHVTDVPVGQRCWHFTFTPDGAKILLACGRSNAVYVLDAATYSPIKQIGGFPLAWGIVTNPPSDGTIESR
jgi:YVTN family beta-propeller protein